MLRGSEKRLHLGTRVSSIWAQPPYFARYSAAVIASTPQLYWVGDDASSHFLDSSGNANDSTTEAGTLTYGGTGPLPDLGSLSARKGASGDIHRNATGTAVNNVTIEGWVRLQSSVGSNRTLFSADQTGKGWGIIMTTASKFAVVVQNVAIQANCAATLTTGVWYHICCVRDAGTWKYYFNGAVDNASAGTGLPIANTAGFIGVGRDASAMVFDWAHFAYYESALSATTVANHYLAGTLA